MPRVSYTGVTQHYLVTIDGMYEYGCLLLLTVRYLIKFLTRTHMYTFDGTIYLYK